MRSGIAYRKTDGLEDGLLLCPIVLKKMLSYVSILVMWKYFTDFEEDDFNCTGKFC